MTSLISEPSGIRARRRLEGVVAGHGIVGGAAVAVAGSSYGLTNVTGVGAGFFPLVAGVIIALGASLWMVQLCADVLARRHAENPHAAEADAAPLAPFDRVDPPTDTAIGVLVADGVEEEDDDVALPDRQGVLRVAMVALSLVLAAILLPMLGYVITMTLMLFAVMTLVSRRTWWMALVIALIAAFASRFVFETLLGTALPHASIPFIHMIGL